jgi:hypothetical protein
MGRLIGIGLLCIILSFTESFKISHLDKNKPKDFPNIIDSASVPFGKIVSITTAFCSFNPVSPAFASSQDAIDLLTGYKPHTPDVVTWIVLIVGAYMTQYKIFKWLAQM